MHKIFVKIKQKWLILTLLLVSTVMGGAAFVVHGRTQNERHDSSASVRYIPEPMPVFATATTTTSPSAPVTNISTMCTQNTTGKVLLVSISEQHMWACDGSQLAYDSAVTTGASALKNVDDATPTGTWHIYSKQTNTILRGCDPNGCWRDAVAYWMPFDDQVGFHDASWQTFAFGDPQYTTGGSHGCVHLPNNAAAWVYDWAPVGTTVTVQA